MNVVRTLHLTTLMVAVLVVAAACSAGSAQSAGEGPATSVPATSAPAEPVAPRPTRTVDQRVAVDGARMHLTCSGSGPSTVVLVAGLESPGASWATVADEVSQETRVCAYDRFGVGTSDAPPSRQTFATQAADLHALLETAGEPGPYVLAGHSFGGSVAVSFAARFADEVEGLLMVDASPVDWPAAACAVPDDGSAMAASFQDTCAMLSDPRRNVERLDAMAAFEEVGEVASLGDLPMAVLTRADVGYSELAADSRRALVRTWNDGQAHWASLSSSSRVVPVEDTSHYIPTDQPAVVAEHLLSLVP